jgi:hypothetical protein
LYASIEVGQRSNVARRAGPPVEVPTFESEDALRAAVAGVRRNCSEFFDMDPEPDPDQVSVALDYIRLRAAKTESIDEDCIPIASHAQNVRQWAFHQGKPGYVSQDAFMAAVLMTDLDIGSNSAYLGDPWAANLYIRGARADCRLADKKRAAENEPAHLKWINQVLKAKFPEAPENSAPANPFIPITADEFCADTGSNDWIVKGWLPKGGLGAIIGAAGSAKTFFTFDMVAAIGRGQARWCGQRINAGRAAYVVTEGQKGFQKRVRAYCRHHGIEPSDLNVEFIPAAPNLLKNDYRLLIDGIMSRGEFDLIVIDTFARTMPGGDENGSESMGLAISRCGKISTETGASVLLVHHVGKDASRGARGWSGFTGALDFEMTIDRREDDEVRTARVTKAKDDVDGERMHFRLKVVELDADADGDEVTSCVVEWVDAPKPEQKPAGKWQTLTYRAILECTAADGAGPTIDEVIEAAKRETTGPAAGKEDRRREWIRRAVDGLLAVGLVAQTDGRFEASVF